MFTSARIKLTIWYLLITILVSLAFSAVVYRMLALEVDRFDRIQRYRYSQNFYLIPPNPDLIEEAKHRIILTIALVDLGIWAGSAALGFFLAGRALRPIQEMVAEQNRFISDASHELKTPLTSLKSAFEVYLRGKPHRVAEAENIINESIIEVNKLQRLSESLLTLAHYEQSRVIKLQPVALKPILEAAVHQVEPLAKVKQIDITANYLETQVLGDSTSLAELFVILLDNAIKYSPEKTNVEVTTRETKSEVVVSVADHGIGIKLADKMHIFDRFFRSDTARSSNGYGLGLAIAKKIADQHRVSIHVDSQPDQGSTFTVSFQKALLNSKA